MKKLFYFGMVMAFSMSTLNCSKNRIFAENKDMPSNFHWEKDHLIEFFPQITDTLARYNFNFSFRHVYGFKLKKFDIKIVMSPPSGNAVKKIFTISLFDKNNKALSDCSGDYCDLETLIEENFKFKETGKYQFKITYNMDAPFIPNVMQLGLTIDKK
jgi:gliding motility-associated lipoprotein GldH